MSGVNQRGIVTRETEAAVLRMFATGAAQHKVTAHFGLSKGTVSKLINGVYPFVPEAGEPDPQLPQLRDTANKLFLARHLKKGIVYMRRVADSLGVAV